MRTNRQQYKRRHTWAPIIRYTIDDDIFEVVSVFNEAYISDMKTKIPPRYRKWNPDDRIWTFNSRRYLPVIRWLLQNYYSGYIEEWPELSDLDRLVRGMVREAKSDAKKEWSAREIVL